MLKIHVIRKYIAPSTRKISDYTVFEYTACWLTICRELDSVRHQALNHFKPSGVKWLHFKVFRAILV